MLASLVPGAISSDAMAPAAPAPSAQDLLRAMAAAGSDDCSAPSAPSSEVHDKEDRLFSAAEAVAEDALNRPAAASFPQAVARARSALAEVERASARINREWPDEERFHFEVYPMQPAVLVRLSYRDHATLILFGAFYLSGDAAVDAGTKWRAVSLVDLGERPSRIDVFPLHRGPSRHVRFLATAVRSGCAGSIGVAYYGYEWRADDGQMASQIIKIEGAEGLDDTASKHVGALRTAGNTVELPYCFFSAVDTWDNPTLCAADSFDLRQDDVRFLGRVYNHPDLVVLNSAFTHAQARDYRALRAYCASDAVAGKLMRQMPPYLHADDLTVVKTGRGRERVAFADDSVHFDLVNRRGEWRLESFSLGSNTT